MINQSLFKFLNNLQKLQNDKIEEKKYPVCFVIPGGVVRGNFKNYDHDTEVVTISDSYISDIHLDIETTIQTAIIQAWGKG